MHVPFKTCYNEENEVIIMGFDGVVTRAITKEMIDELRTGRILKIYQPTKTELVLTIRAHGKNKSLLLSAHPSYARVHITKDSYHNPTEPPMFCMLLRKHLVGSFIETVEQYENERIISFSIRGKNEIGDEIRKTLRIELMGKHSNILLLDQEKGHILDSIKHVSPNQNRHRTILPGQDYVYPPSQDKQNPITLDKGAFEQLLAPSEDKLAQQLVNSLMGVSPLLANEIIHRANNDSRSSYADVFTDVMNQIKNHQYTPIIYMGNKEDFYVLELQQYTQASKTFDTVSIMLDAFYSGKAERDRVKQQAGDLARLLKNELEKNNRKIKKQQQTIKKADRADSYQRKGELLTAHLHLVNQGDSSVEVVDYYDPDQKTMKIELNPNKTPSENAQSYFKTYQKLKTSKAKLAIEIEKAHSEIRYLTDLIQQVETAREEDIDEIRQELREQGYLKTKGKQPKKQKKQVKPNPETYYSSDGTPILVGRNNKQNEYLTNRLAAKNDIWLHTKDIPGSHVIIRSANPSEDTLAEAAQLAALFSKASTSSSVPVDYTEVRHVKKPNGAKPGYVTYDQQKTVFVTPDRSFLETLKENPLTTEQGK